MSSHLINILLVLSFTQCFALPVVNRKADLLEWPIMGAAPASDWICELTALSMPKRIK